MRVALLELPHLCSLHPRAVEAATPRTPCPRAPGLYNALLLGFSSALCDGLRVRGAIGCAHSSYMYTGALADRAQAWGLRPNYRAWLQKFHYMVS